MRRDQLAGTQHGGALLPDTILRYVLYTIDSIDTWLETEWEYCSECSKRGNDDKLEGFQ